MPKTLNWPYVWPRLSLQIIALALVVLAGAGALYWNLQKSNAETQLALAIMEAVDAANVVAGAADVRPDAQDANTQERREALAKATDRLRAYAHIMARTTGEPGLDGKAPSLSTRQALAATATMPAKAVALWSRQDDGQSPASALSEMVTTATALAADESVSRAAAQASRQQIARLNSASVGPALRAVRDVLNEGTVAAGPVSRTILVLTAVATVVVAAMLFAIMAVAMIRRSGHPEQDSGRSTGIALTRAAKRKGDRIRLDVLAALDGEIRTSMNGVVGTVDLLGRTELDDKQRTYVDVIAASGAALRGTVENVIDYARADCGALHLDPKPFSLRECAQSVAEAMIAEAALKGVELVIRVAPDLPDGYVGDVARVRQVMTALVERAITASDGGDVMIDISGVLGSAKTVSLAFNARATNTDISGSELAGLFDAPSQERDVVSGGDLRLRLALSGRLVRLMNGKVSAEAPSDDSMVLSATMSLPLDTAQTAAAEKFGADGDERRLLVIDDNAASRECLVEALSDMGFSAVAAESGRLGGLFANHMAGLDKPLDVILIDSDLGEEDGLDVVQDLKADAQVSAAALVLMMSNGEPVPQADAMPVGVTAAFAKPAGPLRLAAALRKALASPATQATADEDGQQASVKPVPQADAGAKALDELAEVVGQLPDHVAKSINDDLPLQVLVAEDNEVNQLVFSQILEGLDLRFRIAVNGRDAVRDFKTHRPEIVLMDVSMPEMNGLDATRAIREFEEGEGAHTPIIGVTAHSLRGDQQKCVEAGMDDYMAKPISPDMIGAKIAKWMERRQPANERRRA